MLPRDQGPTNESLAQALSRVVVTRQEGDYEWATQEGRGDRMPRFLERAIQDVPHAARQQPRYQGRSRRPLTRTVIIMSLVGAGIGAYVGLANPAALDPVFATAHSLLPFSLVPQANAAIPRLAFGEVLRNYAFEASAQAAKANIIVRDVAPGTVLSAGEQVAETEWSLPQSELDNLVITFPRGVAPDAMRATMHIPGNVHATSGAFSVELRQAPDSAATGSSEGEPTGVVEPAAAEADGAVAPAEAKAAPLRKAKVQRKDGEDDKGLVKRKVKPQAALAPKRTYSQPETVKVEKAQPVPGPSGGNAKPSGDGEPTLLGTLLPFVNANASTNQTTMFSLGGPFLPE